MLDGGGGVSARGENELLARALQGAQRDDFAVEEKGERPVKDNPNFSVKCRNP